ncbi:two component transcriptional regulator [Rhodospirillum rubrum F11]|nr:winged helix-turn-helix domain-containing protein [Rhodospirillum rubrum]AEO50183.1 two component transcriptional regulator [Rhodospirillum rubrum F11]QXG80354.1 winged helix-turn-helix domain-containing protein [Rhodospirillum rubrum]
MTSGKRLLLVVEDDSFRRALGEQLRAQEDFGPVDEVTSLAQALERAATAVFDLLLVDLGAGEGAGGGETVCRALREAGIEAPLVLLAGPGAPPPPTDLGPVERVDKPVRLGALLALLRARMKAKEGGGEESFIVGPYRFQPADKMLVGPGEGRSLRLTEKETGILAFLCRAGGKAVDRETLLHEVWGYGAGITTHTLETHIYRLRRKMEADPVKARVLLTEDGGYRLGS